MTEIERTYCAGSGKKIPKGMRGQNTWQHYGYSLKYPCPDCGKLLGKDNGGCFNKHGWKQEVPDVTKKFPSKKCPNCKKKNKMDPMDYLCVDCRKALDGELICA